MKVSSHLGDSGLHDRRSRLGFLLGGMTSSTKSSGVRETFSFPPETLSQPYYTTQLYLQTQLPRAILYVNTYATSSATHLRFLSLPLLVLAHLLLPLLVEIFLLCFRIEALQLIITLDLLGFLTFHGTLFSLFILFLIMSSRVIRTLRMTSARKCPPETRTSGRRMKYWKRGRTLV